jgi:N-acetylmuramoyl-L-alanine amidase
MRPINLIIVHCSDSAFGDVAEIRRWHTSPDPKDPSKPWHDIGYHYVVLNGVRKNDSDYNQLEDGLVECGRPIYQIGSHCLGDNENSIGVCLVGKQMFSEAQLRAAAHLVATLRHRYNPTMAIFGHCERPSGIQQHKTCPNLDMNAFRMRVLTIEKDTTAV